MNTCRYKNQLWQIYGYIEDAVILIKEVKKEAFAIQYKRIIVNNSEINC